MFWPDLKGIWTPTSAVPNASAGDSEQCGIKYENAALKTAEREDWVWEGPEVARVYPPDEVIKRIAPLPGSKTVMRWVPYTKPLSDLQPRHLTAGLEVTTTLRTCYPGWPDR